MTLCHLFLLNVPFAQISEKKLSVYFKCGNACLVVNCSRQQDKLWYHICDIIYMEPIKWENGKTLWKSARVFQTGFNVLNLLN